MAEDIDFHNFMLTSSLLLPVNLEIVLVIADPLLLKHLFLYYLYRPSLGLGDLEAALFRRRCRYSLQAPSA